MGISANWSRESLAWCGGLFEGEGTIWSKPGVRVTLKMAMTDEDSVVKFGSLIGIGTVNGPYKRGGECSHYKPTWVWSCDGGKKCLAVIAALWPFLGERRKQRAKEAIRVIANMTRKKMACPHGHPYDDENTYLYRGERLCRSCRRNNGFVFRLKQKQKALNVSLELHHASDRNRLRASQV